MGKILLVLIIIIVLIIIWLISGYNGLVRSRNTVEEAFSTMDVYLKKRYDLIPNLVEAVKGYAAHEKETLQAVIAARGQIQSAGVEIIRHNAYIQDIGLTVHPQRIAAHGTAKSFFFQVQKFQKILSLRTYSLMVLL